MRASGSSSTAPETDVANFLSGNWIRAIWGLKAEAVRARSRVMDGGRDEEEEEDEEGSPALETAPEAAAAVLTKPISDRAA